MKRSVELSPLPSSPPVNVIVPNDVNLFVPPSLASILNELGTSEPLPTEFALIVCAWGVTKTSTFGTAAVAFEKLNLTCCVPSVPSKSLKEIEAIPIAEFPLNEVTSIVDVLGVVSATVTPVTSVILNSPALRVPWLYDNSVLPSAPFIVISVILLFKLPNESASIVCACGSTLKFELGCAFLTRVTTTSISFWPSVPSPSVNFTGIKIVPVSSVISDASDVIDNMFELIEPVNPLLNVGVFIEVNLSVPPSVALTKIFCGVAEPLPSELASIVCANGLPETSTFGWPTLVLEIVDTIVLVPWVPSLSVKVTGIVIVSVSDVISDAESVITIVFVDIEPVNPPLYVGLPIESNREVPPSVALNVKLFGVAEPEPLEFPAIVCAIGETASSIFGTEFLALV